MTIASLTRLLLRVGLAGSLLGATASLAACAADTGEGANTSATNEDGDAPLADLDALLEGAPDNAGLPDEGKADAVYPATYTDLVASQSPVRSQGSRGVCSIFATVAYMEHLYLLEGSTPNPDFSEQFLQWSAKVELGEFTHTEGSSGDANLRAINRFGIVAESDWPYETFPWGASNDEACGGEENQRPTRCFTNGDPPEAARTTATRYMLPRGRWISSRVNSIKAHMYENHTAVLVGGTFYYQSWNHRRSTLPTNQEYWRNGYVLPPNDEDRRVSLEKRAGHAFVLVGWDDNLEVQRVDAQGQPMVDAEGQPVMERGFFIFKNSWGTGSFGVNNPHGAGFGFIAYTYVAELSANVAGLPTPPRPREACGNGSDDDGDNLVDCADSDCAMDAACAATGGSTYTSTAALDIPDNDPAGARSDVQVTDAGAARALRVTVDIQHTYRGDLVVKLVRNGTEITLLDRSGGGQDDVRETFTLDRFLGEDAQGTWTLAVVDTARQDTGVLRSWSLEVAR